MKLPLPLRVHHRLLNISPSVLALTFPPETNIPTREPETSTRPFITAAAARHAAGSATMFIESAKKRICSFN